MLTCVLGVRSADLPRFGFDKITIEFFSGPNHFQDRRPQVRVADHARQRQGIDRRDRSPATRVPWDRTFGNLDLFDRAILNDECRRRWRSTPSSFLAIRSVSASS